MASIGGLDMSYAVGRCTNCGFLYAYNLPAAQYYSHYYTKLSKYDHISSHKEIPPIDLIRAQATVDICAPYLQADSAIADLGCGIGTLLHTFKLYGGFDLYGLDPAPMAAERARTLFGLTGVRQGLLSDSAALLPIERITLVCLTGVLEHLFDPYQDLKNLFTELQPGTLVLVEVPALERFSRHPFEPFGEFSLEHIQYFSEHSLQNMFLNLGASTINTKIVHLGSEATDSLYGLFMLNKHTLNNNEHSSNSKSDSVQLASYIAHSTDALESAITRIADAPPPYVIYGAGSHTARLLPALQKRGLDSAILVVVDSNVNLHGQQMGRWTISPPEVLENYPNATVIISSFRSQNAIQTSLSKHYSNKTVCLYP